MSLRQPAGAAVPAVLGRHVSPLDADAGNDRPGEDGAEEQDRAEIAVGEEMGERPDLHAGEHRVLEPCLDATRQIGRGDADEGDPDQEKRQVAGPDRRIPDRDIAAGAVLAVADGDQDDADHGQQGIDPLVGALPDPFDQRGPARPCHAEAMHAEKNHKAKNEQRHDGSPEQGDL